MENSKQENLKAAIDRILNKTFKYAKQVAKNFYFKEWAENPPKCPAFNGEVVKVTREGWEHIIDETSRTKSDVLGRLFVLMRARALLETATTFITKEVKAEKTYWLFEGVIAGVRIKVVVRSIDEGAKHFLTVIKKGTIDDEVSRDSNAKENTTVSRL